MKALFAVALEFQLTIPEVLDILKAEGYSINTDYRTKLTKQQYATVAGSQGKEVEKAQPRQTKQQFGFVKFFAADKGFGFITSSTGEEDFFFRGKDLKAETVTDGNPVVFTTVPSKRKPGTNEARKIIHFSDCKNTELLCAVYLSSNDVGIRQIALGKIQPGDFRYLLTKELEQLPYVTSEQDYNALRGRVDIYQAWLSTEKDKKSLDAVAQRFLQQGPQADYFTIRWWLDGRSELTPGSDALVAFYQTSSRVKRMELLPVINEATRKKALTRQGKHEGYPELLLFLEDYVGRLDGINSIHQNDIYIWASNLVLAHINQQQEAELFFSGHLERVNLDFLSANPDWLTETHIDFLVSKVPEYANGKNPDFFFAVMKTDIKNLPDSETEAIKRAKHFKRLAVSEGEIGTVVNFLQHNLPEQYRAKWWEEDLLPDRTDEELNAILAASNNPMASVARWQRLNLISQEKAEALAGSFLREIPDVANQLGFYRLYDQITDVRSHLDLEITQIPLSEHNQQFYNLATWLKEPSKPFRFNQFRNKLAYLNGDDQVLFLRKMFGLAHNNTINLTPEMFRELTVIDLDIHQLALRHHPEDFLDISLYIVIETINAFHETGKFLLEGELLRVLMQNLTSNENPALRFKVNKLFERCKGRTVLEHDFTGGRRVEIETGDSNQQRFALHFPFDQTIVDAVKSLPQRRFLADRRVWVVPLQYEDQIHQFAIDNGFRLEIGGNRYENNAHLAKHKKTDVPGGITFCEGRLAKTVDNVSKNPFWWCHNQPCYDNCETVCKPEEWESYTLLDFMLILGFNLDAGNRIGDLIEKGQYHQFLGHLNRFRVLLDRLYCRECDHILHPVDTSNYAHYRVVRFHCENESCSKHHHEVYLHHCFNRKCESIIDSRDSKKCPNGWYICSSNTCGCCCSHYKNAERKENLKKADQPIPNKLLYDVEHKTGHLERAQHFCSKCGQAMEEIANEVFVCKPCVRTLHLVGNRFKRIHRGEK